MPHATLKRKDWFQPDGFPIAVERRDPQEPFGLHTHEFSEIVIITSGRGVHITGKESYPLNTGDAFVIGGSRQHDYHSMERLCLVNILFQPEKLNLRAYDLRTLPGYHALFTLEPAWRQRHQFQGRLRLTPQELNVAMAFVDQLDEELRARTSGFKFMATASFMQIVGYLSRCFARAKNPDSRALLRIGEAISHLEANYRERIDLDQLAGMAHMSRRNFMRSFQAAMGTSPIAHLIQLRVNQAASLLRRTGHSVTDIAFQVGFSDSNYFARQFRTLLGVTPSQYRQQHTRLA
ncbi:MAG TPA: helix-turn-helix domain-containing protein [Candidatus Binatia bacterium]|nr:helix-turn-helix domain-containing protein [Candidatus Binatia bacterium]